MLPITHNAETRRERSPLRLLAWSFSASVAVGAVALAAGTRCPVALVCWGLVAAGVVGTHLAGRGSSRGWLLLVSLQPLWITYAVTTEQYGFVVGAVAYGLGQLKGYLRSRREGI